jgi:hypothetical protein
MPGEPSRRRSGRSQEALGNGRPRGMAIPAAADHAAGGTEPGLCAVWHRRIAVDDSAERTGISYFCRGQPGGRSNLQLPVVPARLSSHGCGRRNRARQGYPARTGLIGGVRAPTARRRGRRAALGARGRPHPAARCEENLAPGARHRGRAFDRRHRPTRCCTVVPFHSAKFSSWPRWSLRVSRNRCDSIRQANFFMPFLWHSFTARHTRTMAREANPIKTELITLSLNPQTIWYLDRMVELGVYGNNRTEAARVAIYDHCKMLIAERKLDLAPPPANIEISSGQQPSSVARR